jgi:hypothetical protein
MRLKSFKNITMDLDKLHKDDQLWIIQKHSAQGTSLVNKNLKKIDETAVFDTLVFGDSRDTVTKKLFASKLVSSNTAMTHIGRTGLNNVFTTRDKIAGLTCSLTFNWGSNGELIEVTLQTENKSLQEYSSVLKPSLEEFEKLLISIYGNPKQSTEMSKPNELKDDQMLASQVWRLDQGGSILLGSSKMEGSYQVVVRFTKEIF